MRRERGREKDEKRERGGPRRGGGWLGKVWGGGPGVRGASGGLRGRAGGVVAGGRRVGGRGLVEEAGVGTGSGGAGGGLPVSGVSCWPCRRRREGRWLHRRLWVGRVI
ncbi:hypothetical protein TIFTF001_056677 [Ficus carica]|uniref:Uncharacterized protein n=1 Tax=Ficus carica TaxID=3494 RepID=A0AA88EN80_FICCA|nr:hypothetical protein TIFTF001_056677 [Ficus carica]